MRAFILTVLFILSSFSQSYVTEEFPNVRIFYKEIMNKNKGWVVGSSFIVAMIPIYGWTFCWVMLANDSYFEARDLYYIFKSSYDSESY